MAIGTQGITKIIEEIEIEEIVGIEDPITETTDKNIEVGEIVMIEIEAEDIAETIIVETGGKVQPIAMDYGVQEVPQEDEMEVDMTGVGMTDIENDLVKAREEKKNDIITRIVVKRTTVYQNSNLPGNGSLLTKKEK